METFGKKPKSELFELHLDISCAAQGKSRALGSAGLGSVPALQSQASALGRFSWPRHPYPSETMEWNDTRREKQHLILLPVKTSLQGVRGGGGFPPTFLYLLTWNV